MRWLAAHDHRRRVTAVPSQAPGVLATHGLTRADADRSVWAVYPDGRMPSGADAVNAVLLELGGGWRLAGRVGLVPPINWAERGVYALFARNRSALSRWFGVTPECDRPGVDCGGGESPTDRGR
ncbi:MAG: DUF393 domain-containing protein [Candidatus Dormibacteraeota bacterium]|nr:DUF393 domain-containing protein [Candidatus Dormibacteraeota bacterium]